MRFSQGEAVCSTAGRDAKKCFLVVEVVDEQFVLIADGKLHKIEKPKKKKIKHLASLGQISQETAQKLTDQQLVTNGEIRKVLATIKAKKGEE
ncbi:MAG: RNA-binding protein [Clostridia bacterium]|nr:RNA-binding protein [Clostridia bacterium]